MKYCNGKKCYLDKARIKKLEQLGYDWGYAIAAAEGSTSDFRGRAPRKPYTLSANRSKGLSRVPWNNRYQQLVVFLAARGNTRVPQGWKDNPQLAHWVNEQRRLYRFRELGRPHSMSDERIARLEGIGFEWKIQDHSKRWGKKEVLPTQAPTMDLTETKPLSPPTRPAQEQVEGYQQEQFNIQQHHDPHGHCDNSIVDDYQLTQASQNTHATHPLVQDHYNESYYGYDRDIM